MRFILLDKSKQKSFNTLTLSNINYVFLIRIKILIDSNTIELLIVAENKEIIDTYLFGTVFFFPNAH